MLDDAWRDGCWPIGSVLDEAADAAGVLDAAPGIAVGIEPHEQVAAEQRDDTVGFVPAWAFEAEGQVAVPALFDEALEGFVFGLWLGPDAVPAWAG